MSSDTEAAKAEASDVTLYDELRSMCVLAFFIYDFAFIVDASRKTDKTFVGLDVDSEALSKSVVKSAVEDASLARSFTPHEVKELVQNNIEILSDYDSLFRGSSLEKMYATLDRLIEIADQSGLSRPFTVEEFDDRLQKQECVYGIVKDAINERIIVVFRGTENELAFSSNWRSNASIFFRKVELPDILKGKLSDDDGTWKFHSGFHKYLFGDKDDEVGTRKYDDIMDDLKSMLAKYPNYRVFVTGHSLGAALSSVTALYFACEEDLPKPIHCINFASPRMGNEQVLEATVHLEKTNQLRMLRSVNENDTVTTLPTLGYEHVGVQVTAYKRSWWSGKSKAPDITYRNPNYPWHKRWRMAWSNNVISNINFGYDHSDYLKRIDQAKEHLEKTHLKSLYLDEDFVGFKLEE